MKKSHLLAAVCVYLTIIMSVYTHTAQAALIEVDFYTFGDALITRDTGTGLDWLDLTETTNLSFNAVSSLLGSGALYEGWRYATLAEIVSLWDSAGGDSTMYDGGINSENDGLFEYLAPFWGDTVCAYLACGKPGEENTFFIYDTTSPAGSIWVGNITDLIWDSGYDQSLAYTMLHWQTIGVAEADAFVGSALVRNSPIPIPQALILFCSGLFGLVGLARSNLWCSHARGV